MMDRESKKRARDEQHQQLRTAVVSEESDEAAERRKGRRKTARGGDVSKEFEKGQERDGVDRPPPGLFEFPWQKGGRLLTAELDADFDMRDIFFTSLVDGCSASVGIPGARFSTPPTREWECLPEIEASWRDSSVWSFVLDQPRQCTSRGNALVSC